MALRTKMEATKVRFATMGKVSQALRKFGLKIKEVSLGTCSMQVSGKVAEMEAAFHPRLGVYRGADQP